MASIAPTYLYLKAPLQTPFFTFPPPALFFFFTWDFFPWQRRLLGWDLLPQTVCPEAFSNSKALVCLNTLHRISPLRLAAHLDTEMWLPRS